MSESPCKSGRTPEEIFCPHMAQDKNKEPCLNCQAKLEYAVSEGMLSEEVLEQKEDPLIKEARETVPTKKKSYSKPEIVKVDKKTKIIDLEKKETLPIAGKKGKKKTIYINLHFSEKLSDEAAQMINDLKQIAKKEMRNSTKQALYFIREGIERWKESHKGDTL